MRRHASNQSSRFSFTIVTLATWLTCFSLSLAQTTTSCNPLRGICPEDPALGTSASADFTAGESDDFAGYGNPTYDENGAGLTVSQSGDAPTVISNWYIMFGRVDVTLKAAPGVGIVSSVVLQSDDLDEIDWEFLGADSEEVQLMYFGKGKRGSVATVSAPGSQDDFHTYTLDWNADQLVWQIDGETVRTLAASDAPSLYPQTPMKVKIGSWSGGDPGNEQGTIAWAGGTTDYSQGPFTMYAQSVSVQDYSTGTSYKYTDTSGTWQSIEAVGGSVGSSGSSSSTATGTIVTPTNPSNCTIYSLPSGWTITSDCKVLPPSAAISSFHTERLRLFVLSCAFVATWALLF